MLVYNKFLATRGFAPHGMAGDIKFTPLFLGDMNILAIDFLDRLEEKLVQISMIGGETLSIDGKMKYITRPEITRLNSHVYVHTIGTCSVDKTEELKYVSPRPKFTVKWTNPIHGAIPESWEGPSFGVVDYTEPVMFFYPMMPRLLDSFRQDVYMIEERTRPKGKPDEPQTQTA